jgi:hypothetical protein
MQHSQIRVGQLFTEEMTIVAILQKPSLMGGNEEGKGFGVEKGGRVGDSFVDGDFGDETVVVEGEVDVEGD